MHGRGPKAGAPASDAAGRGDTAGTPQTARPCRVGPRRATWQVPNRADAAEVGADSAEIGADAAKIGPTRPYRPYRPKRPVSAETAETAESGRNSKKKKKKRCKRTVPLSLRPSSPLQKNPVNLEYITIYLYGKFHKTITKDKKPKYKNKVKTQYRVEEID